MPKLKVKAIGKISRFLRTSTKRKLLLYGGSDSGKSHGVAQHLILRKFYRERGIGILVTRKTLPALRDSCYGLILKLLDAYELPYELNKSTMTIINGPNFIKFKSLDDVSKLKSIEGIDYVWCEEATEITEQDYMQLNLRCRGDDKGIRRQLYFTFNPADFNSFLKPLTQKAPPDTAVSHTTFQDNPFVEKEYGKQLDGLKEVDKAYYSIYREGVWAALRNLVYENWDEVERWPSMFEKSCYALDFGFAQSKTALLELGLVDKDLFERELVYAKGWTNADLREWLKGQVDEGAFDTDKVIVADSARADCIQELRDDGFAVIGSRKGAGSIRAGIDRVKRLKTHAFNSPGIIGEKKSYKWKEDRHGEPLGIPVDYRNDCLDAERYGVDYLLEGEMDISGYGSASHMAAQHQKATAKDANAIQEAIDSLAKVDKEEMAFICQGFVRNPSQLVQDKLRENLEHADSYIAGLCDDMLETIELQGLAAKAKAGEGS